MAAPWDGRLVSYLGSGTAAARPPAPNIAPGVLGVWFSTDTVVISYWDSTGLAWFDYPTPQTVEQTQDMIATLLVAGTNMSIVYNDGAGTITLNGQSDESIQDMLSTFLVAGTNVTLTYNDGANTLTIAATTPSLDLDDLADVDTTGVADGDVLTYDSGDSTWKPAAPTGGGGGGGGFFDISMGVPTLASLTQIGNATYWNWTENSGKALNIEAEITMAAANGRIAGFAEARGAGDYHYAWLVLSNQYHHRYYGPCVGIRDSATGRIATFGFLSHNSGGMLTIYRHHFSDPDTRNAVVTETTEEVWGMPFVWMHLKRVGSNLSFGISADGAKPTWYYTGISETAYTATPNQIFFGAFAQSTDFIGAQSWTYICYDTAAGSRLMGPP